MSRPDPKMVQLLQLVKTGENIRMWVEGISLVFGVFGSVMILIVLGRKTMSTFSPRVYFIGLALVDLVAMIAGIPFDLFGYSRSGFGNAYNVITCQVSSATSVSLH